MTKRGWTGGFLNSVAASAAWDTIKAVVVGPLLIPSLAAVWQYCRHRSVDWWGIAGLLTLTLFLGWVSHKASPAAQTLSGESPSIRRNTLDVQDIIHDGSEMPPENQRVLFTPLQLTAFYLAKDIDSFMGQMGPMPDYSHVKARDFDEAWEHIQARSAIVNPWATRLQSGYEKRYKPRLAGLLLDAGELGFHNVFLKMASDRVKDDEGLREVRDRIIVLAHELDGVHLDIQKGNNSD